MKPPLFAATLLLSLTLPGCLTQQPAGPYGDHLPLLIPEGEQIVDIALSTWPPNITWHAIDKKYNTAVVEAIKRAEPAHLTLSTRKKGEPEMIWEPPSIVYTMRLRFTHRQTRMLGWYGAGNVFQYNGLHAIRSSDDSLFETPFSKACDKIRTDAMKLR
jgi:hypothetical protein